MTEDAITEQWETFADLLRRAVAHGLAHGFSLSEMLGEANRLLLVATIEPLCDTCNRPTGACEGPAGLSVEEERFPGVRVASMVYTEGCSCPCHSREK